jgi:ankyrin repeat protein
MQIKKAEIKRLLDAGCDMHAIHQNRGQSAIHFCLLSEYFSEYPLAMIECFRLFLEHNIDPNFQDQQGMPLIGYAVKMNKYQILCLLLFVNCDIHILYRDCVYFNVLSTITVLRMRKKGTGIHKNLTGSRV